jgi:NADH-quinone oxidoreductase subunit E
MAFVLSPDRAREMNEILSRYPTRRAASIPVLHLCQDQEGYVSEEAMTFVAHELDMSPAQVKGVVTFYTLFNTAPVGRHQVWICRTLSCALRGAEDIISHCEKRLGVHVGETTRDGKVTLRTAECLASCGTAPMMQIDKKYYENLSTSVVDGILDRILLDS